jgi:hypothetical protein
VSAELRYRSHFIFKILLFEPWTILHNDFSREELKA